MTTTIKHVTLKSLGKNKDIDPSKGTVTNPFTQEEYNSLNQTGEWPGGYVEAMGYVAPPMMDGGDDGSGSGSCEDIYLHITPGSGDSQTEKIEDYTEFSVHVTFTWGNGYAPSPSPSITGRAIIPESPIFTNDGKYKFVVTEYTNPLMSFSNDFHKRYPSPLSNKHYLVDMYVKYDRYDLDENGNVIKIYKGKIAQLTFRTDVTNYLSWRHADGTIVEE